MEVIIHKSIESLVTSLCKHVCYDKVGEYEVSGKVVEGVFECGGDKRNFRILLASQEDEAFGAVMATVEYGFVERTYRLNTGGAWETL